MSALEVHGDDWFEIAPIRVDRSLIVPTSPAVVFARLAEHERWPEWFDGMRLVIVTRRVRGVGCERTVAVGPISVRERFVVWEENARLGFYIIEATVPGLRAMHEDWRLSDLGDGRTRWTSRSAQMPARPSTASPGWSAPSYDERRGGQLA